MKLADLLLERTITVDTSFVKTLIFDHFDDIIESDFSKNGVHKTLTRIFKPHKIKFKIDNHYAEHFQETDEHLCGVIEAEITINNAIQVILTSTFKKCLKNDNTRERAIRALKTLIHHELVHKEQNTRSNKKAFTRVASAKQQKYATEKWEKYLSDPTETYAMAHEIIEQWKSSGISKDMMLANLKRSRSLLLINGSARYEEFHDTFSGKDPLNIISKLKKLIYQILNQ